MEYRDIVEIACSLNIAGVRELNEVDSGSTVSDRNANCVKNGNSLIMGEGDQSKNKAASKAMLEKIAMHLLCHPSDSNYLIALKPGEF